MRKATFIFEFYIISKWLLTKQKTRISLKSKSCHFVNEYTISFATTIQFYYLKDI